MFLLFWLGICLWAEQHKQDYSSGGPPAIIFLGIFVFAAFLLVALAGAILYVGFLVAANREGWRRSGRLPALRWGTMFRQGLGAAVFSGVASMIPYYALIFAFVGMMFAVFSLSHLLMARNETLGAIATLLGLGGMGATFLVALFCFLLSVLMIVPLMQARYAATGQLSSYFRVSWAVRTVALAPGKFLLYQLPTLAFLFLGWLLYLVTLGFAGILLVLFFPYVQLNQAYLMGRYYGEVVDPLLKDDINESTLSEAHRNPG